MSAATAYIVPFNGAQPEAVDPRSLKMNDDGYRLTRLYDALIEKGVSDARIGGFTNKGVLVIGKENLLIIGNVLAETGLASNSNSAPDVMRDFGRAANLVAMMPRRANVMGGFGGYTPMAA